MTYPGTTCFLLCYRVDSRQSFQVAQEKFYPELVVRRRPRQAGFETSAVCSTHPDSAQKFAGGRRTKATRPCPPEEAQSFHMAPLYCVETAEKLEHATKFEGCRVPIVLCGCQTDLRSDAGARARVPADQWVSTEEGQAAASRM